MRCAGWHRPGAVIRTPKLNVRNTTGLRLEIDTQWVDASGYRVVRIHVATANGAPSPVERQLSVQLSPANYAMNEGDYSASRTVTLPQGASTVTEQMFHPPEPALLRNHQPRYARRAT